MKKVTYSLLAIAGLLLVGCHEAKFPIDKEPGVKVDSRLVGTWRVNDKQEKGYYELYKINEYEYGAHLYDYARAVEGIKNEMYLRPLFLSNVDGNTFLNIHLSDAAIVNDDKRHNDKDGYIFVRLIDINKTGSKMLAASIADTNIANLNSAAEVRRYIALHMHQPSFYKDTVQLFRVR